MRAAPALQVSLRRFGVWNAAVLALAGLAMAALIAWLITRERPIGMGVWVGTALSVVAAAALAASALRTRPTRLHWDGRSWHLGSAGADLSQGDLDVTIDLGGWMLLRFIHPAPTEKVVWLPVQRLGIESQWHALRCAVYSPRPVPGDETTGGA